MKIKLLKMHIQNFKGCKDREIAFGDRTSIKGANATGKTTVFDAFTWLLFGKDSLGSAKFDIRPLDADGNMINNLEISVEATIRVDDEKYSLKKTQKQKWKKKRGSDAEKFDGNINEFEINGYPKKESEYKAFIAGIIDEKVFNLITNPSAFSALTWKEQRDILMKFSETISDLDIATIYGEKFSALIPELKIASSDDILKKYKFQKDKLESEKKEIPARIDELSKQVVSVDVGALEVQKAAKQAELKRVEYSLSGGNSTIQEINDFKGQIMDEMLRISGIQNDANAELDEKRRSARKAVNDANDKATRTEREILDAEYLKSDYIKARDRSEADRTRYAEEWKEWKKKTFPEFVPLDDYVEPLPLTDKDLTCPTCGQALPEEVRKQRIADHEKICAKAKADYEDRCEEHRMDYDTKKIMFSEQRKKAMDEITVKGQKAADNVRAYQKQIDEQEKEISALKLRLECEKADLSKAKKDLESIPGIADISDTDEYKEIFGNIHSLESEIAELSKDISGRTELEAKKAVLQDEISDIEAQIKAADNTKVKERIAELEEEQTALNVKCANCERVIDLTEEFTRAKSAVISKPINEKFSVVSFKLFNNLINGGLKETCECTVNGVPYSSLNNGHRIIAGLDIIRSLSELYGVSAPVFIDNSEAISTGNFPDMDTQIIHLIVTDDKELTVESEVITDADN